VSEAIDRGLNEDAVLSVIRRSLASAIAAEAHAGPIVFLAYANADRELVDNFARGLEERRVSTWFDAKIPAGERWDEAIKRALDSADYIVFFVSQNSTKSGNIRHELRVAFDRSRRFPESRIFLIPVLLDKAAIPDMPPLLRDIQWLDATDGDIHKAIDRLVPIIQSSLAMG
jgi:hypothetical protein